ncbi:MAG TPA: chloride channel protein [Puia sp.]|nr:chloride channel protein [Puia sp.]
MRLINGLRNRLKRVFDRMGNEKIRVNILQAFPFWIASIITGLVAVLYAKLFLLAEQGTMVIYNYHAWLLFIVTPVCFVIGWWLVLRFAPYSRGSGIPQVMSSIELATPKDIGKVKKLLSIRIIIVKIFSSLFMVFGGGIIGREGPTIQVAGSIFRKVNQWLPEWWPKISKRNMIMAGAAAGLAAAFNTPLGGIVFAVEELTKTHISYFKTALFTAVIIAGLTAQGFLGPYLYLGYPVISQLSPYIFLAVILVAAAAGLAGSGLAKSILLIMKWKSGLQGKNQQLLYVIFCGLVIASMAFFVDQYALGSGKNLMTTTLFTPEKYVSWYVPLLRMGGSALSFTTGAAGGIFAPSLSAGASIGSLISGWMHLSNDNTNLLILSGMVAFLTGVTRTPFTSAILVLEMTDRHNLIFHLMLAGMIAGIVSMVVDRHSLYDHLKTQYIHDLNKEEAKASHAAGTVPA